MLRLQITLLAIRNIIKEDLGCCPTEPVLVTTPLSYAACLKDHFRSVDPLPTPLNDKLAQIHKDLLACPFVFIRINAVREPLQPPYDGPFKVLERKLKCFLLGRNSTKHSMSTDRLKHAYLDPPDINPPGQPSICIP